jgi:hypothetical protein
MKNVLIPALCFLSACDLPNGKTITETAPASKTEPPKTEPPKTESIKQRDPVQRFVPISANETMLQGVLSSFLALDTKTGKLCRTWDFGWEHPTPTQKSMQDLPTCEGLWVEWP